MVPYVPSSSDQDVRAEKKVLRNMLNLAPFWSVILNHYKTRPILTTSAPSRLDQLVFDCILYLGKLFRKLVICLRGSLTRRDPTLSAIKQDRTKFSIDRKGVSIRDGSSNRRWQDKLPYSQGVDSSGRGTPNCGVLACTVTLGFIIDLKMKCHENPDLAAHL